MALVHLNIAGEDRIGENDAQFERLNPVSGTSASLCAAASKNDAAKAAVAAAAAFPAWSHTGPGERRTLLNKAAEELENRQDALINAMVQETGATKMWSGFNVMIAAGMLREAAAMTTQVTGKTIPSNRPGTLGLAIRKPAGPILAIAPWNAPVILSARAVAMPLACGNTVVLKGSEICPQTHRLLIDALIAAGLPAGVVNYINNAPEDGPAIVETLIKHPAIRRINFTGSTRVGKIIAKHSAENLKPVLLELGGKAPMAVLSDANIGEAVKGAVFGAFFNQGQICMSTERLILDEAIADEFVAAFVARAQGVAAGDPATKNTPLGSVVDLRTAEHISALLEDAEAKGADILLRGSAEGTILQPSIVDRVTPDMNLWRDESFGPIVAITRARGDDEITRLANDTPYGLAASVYGSDIGRVISVAERIESGICHINAPSVYDEPQMPFGGIKASGYGRFGGAFSIDEFTEVRWITINSQPVHLPL